MYSKCAFILFFLFACLFSPAVLTASPGGGSPSADKHSNTITEATLAKESSVLYDSLGLAEIGLNEKAFQYAWKGYRMLLRKGKLANPDIITICDFSQSSRSKRLYIIDLQEMKVLVNTYVAHGRNSGGEFASSFSNKPQSHKSSLGFYVTGQTYQGQHGLSLRLSGQEKDINDKALYRRIVIHGSNYVGDSFLEKNPFNGRSYGCPAIPSDESELIINAIKNGSCLFIYHPTKVYTGRSRIINS